MEEMCMFVVLSSDSLNLILQLGRITCQNCIIKNAQYKYSIEEPGTNHQTQKLKIHMINAGEGFKG